MSDEQAFLDRLAADEDDEVCRLVYADWLDEHDRPTEADRHRQFKAAKAWLVDLASRHRDGYDGETEITYADVIGAGTDYAQSAAAGGWWDGFTQRGDESLRDDMCGEALETYWRMWAIVTGQTPPKAESYDGKLYTPSPFSCSC